MRANVGPQDSTRQVSPERNTTHAALAFKKPSMEVQFPEALALTADVLDMMSHELGNGTAMGQFCGTHAQSSWREALRGERSFLMVDMCRLATSLHPRAKAAVRSACKLILAKAADVSSTLAPTINSKDAAGLALEHVAAIASRVLRCDVHDEPLAERLALHRHIDAARASLDQLEATLLSDAQPDRRIAERRA